MKNLTPKSNDHLETFGNSNHFRFRKIICFYFRNCISFGKIFREVNLHVYFFQLIDQQFLTNLFGQLHSSMRLMGLEQKVKDSAVICLCYEESANNNRQRNGNLRHPSSGEESLDSILPRPPLGLLQQLVHAFCKLFGRLIIRYRLARRGQHLVGVKWLWQHIVVHKQFEKLLLIFHLLILPFQKFSKPVTKPKNFH